MGKTAGKKRNQHTAEIKDFSGRKGTKGAVLRETAEKPLVHVLLIVILGLIVYSNTFHVPFVFDDAPNIVNNPVIKDLKYFIDPAEAKALLFYGPLKIRYAVYLSFALNYKINGLDVTGYHIVNLAIHIINALLVYLIVILTFRTPAVKPLTGQNKDISWLTALFSALLFVAHPIETQAVTYIVQRLASLTAMFYLLSVMSYIKSRISTERFTRYTFYAISIISAVLAMKTKETALHCLS